MGEMIERAVSLVPGIYSVTFTLLGFNTFRRYGVELAGSIAATVNADLRVGSLEETMKISGARDASVEYEINPDRSVRYRIRWGPAQPAGAR